MRFMVRMKTVFRSPYAYPSRGDQPARTSAQAKACGSVGQIVALLWRRSACVARPLLLLAIFGISTAHGMDSNERSGARSPDKGRDTAAKDGRTIATKSGYATADGVKLYYEVAGEGRPIALIHGGGLDRRMWDGQFEVLAERFRVIRYDVRKHGQSTSRLGKYSDSEDLHLLLKQLSVDKATIVGLSMGGRIAIDFTLAYPDMVSGLVPVGPGLSGYKFTWEGIAENSEKYVRAIQQHDLEQAVECMLRNWTDGPRRTPDQVDPVVREHVRKMLSDNIEKPNRNNGGPPPALAAADRLGEIHVPTLAIVGDLDAPDILNIVDKLVNEIDGAKKVVISGAAHMVSIERPDEFNKALLGFLSVP